MLARMMRLLFTAMALLIGCMQPASANSGDKRDVYRVSLLPHSDGISVSEVRYIEDAEHAFTPQLFFVQLLANTINTYTAMPFDKGLSNSRYLLGFSVHNKREQPVALRLITGTPRSHSLHIYLFDDNGNRQNLLQDDATTPFGQRVNAHRLLNTNAFTLAAGQSAFIVVEYKTQGISRLPLMLGMAEAVSRLLENDKRFTWLFYLTGGLTVLLLMWCGVSQKNPALLQLAALFAFGLLAVSAGDGVAFHTLWPSAPQWNALAETVLLYSLTTLGLLLAWRITPRTDTHYVARLLMLLLAICALLLAAGVGWLDRLMLLKWAHGFAAVMLLALLYALASRFAGKPGSCSNMLYLSTLAAIIAAVAALIYLYYALPPGFVLMYATRIAYLAAALAIASPAAVCLRRVED